MKLKPILSRASFRMRINIVYALLHLLAIAGIALGIGAVSNRLLKNETQNNLKQNIALASERLDALLDKIENASLHSLLHFRKTAPISGFLLISVQEH